MVDGKKKAKPPRPAPAPKKPENDSKTGKARGSAALAAAESDERHAAEDDDLLSSSDEQLKFKRSGTAPAQKKSLNVTKKQGKARASAALTAAENEEPDAAEAESLPSSSDDDDDSSLDKGAAGLLQLDGRKQNKKSETMSVDSNVWKLRNAAAVGYGNARANTRGNAKFAAKFSASLLRERGCVCRVGDAEEVLGWLESEPFGPPSDELWRRLGMASK